MPHSYHVILPNVQMNPSSKPPTLDGWNDPPANLTLSDNMSTKRVSLNKRVPYTNQDLTSPNNAASTLSAPPPGCASTVVTSSEQDKTVNETGPSIGEIEEIFRKQITKLEESPNIEKKIIEDINKKFQVMHDEWCQDKLTMPTKQTLSSIFDELDSNNVQKAFDIHVTLVRNASSEVVRFIVGIKRLIQELQRLTH